MINILSAYAIPVLLVLIPLGGMIKHLPVYELFIDGASEGIKMSLQIFPYLLAMLVAIAMFRASGAFDLIADILQPVTSLVGIPEEVLPLAVMRPLSGSGSLALASNIIREVGPDSFTGILASVMQGSTDTTFYILSVYFGAVGITKYRYAAFLGVSADLMSFLFSFIVCKLFFF